MTSNFDYQIPGSDSFAQTVDPSKLTHYQILGVRQGATENEILKAYRTKARIFHPDKTGNDASEEWMKKINDAKSVLLSEKREDYDEKLADEGQAVIDPAGYLPGGPRLSLQFLQYFNNAKISFEAGFICTLQNFYVILRRDFAENPKQLPALPFTGQSLIQSATPAASKIQALDSPLNEVLEEMNSILDTPQLSTLVDMQSKKLRDIIKMTKTLGTRQTLPEVDGKVPILNFSNVPNKSLQLFHTFFMVSSDQTVLHRDKMLSDLVKFVPYVALQQPSSEVQTQSTCSGCARKLNFFHKAKHTCYNCKSQFCKDCPPKQVVLPRLQPKRAEPVCSTCLQRFAQQDVEDWTKSSLHLIEVGTVKSAKAAMGCLNVALCLSASSTKPIIRVAQGLFHNGLPELAMPFVATVLDHSKDTRELLGAYVLSAQIFKSMADETNDDPEVQWSYLLAAKDSCNLAFEQASCLDSGSIEIPSCSTLKKGINDSLHLLREQQEHIHELEVQLLCSQMENLWQKRECDDLLALVLDEDSAISSSFLPHMENMTVVALEHFLAPKNGFLDRMLDADRCALIFFRGLTKILKKRVSDGLADIEEAAYGSHHDEWLKEAAADVLVSLLTKDPALLFPPDSFKETLRGEHLLSSTVLGDRVELLFPQKHETIPPFNRNWPELTVTGLNIKGHMKFEKAVISQVDQEEWDAKDAAMAYIDYVPACCHPAEVALCFLNAAMWLLKQLQTNLSSSSKRSLSEIYATKQLIVRCLHNSLAVAYLRLHPGMQLYVSRLCLGTAMQTMQLTESFGTKEDVELVTNLLELMIYNCRFCPVWHFPSVPLSEAVLMNIKTGQFHKDFLIALQDVSRDKWPMTPPELLYQLYENDLRYTCPLEDPDGARARAMEEMLCERGWTWNDVANRMKSPLSPRDSDGWLIQQPFLGVPMAFAKLKGFSFNLDPNNPSIEIIAIPASNLKGKVGLFSMEDVQTVLQLDATELYPIFFSLDPPNENQRFHPFQQFRYRTEKLQKTPLLHTLFETDYLLKSFSVGAEVSAKPPFNQRPCKEGLTKNLPPHLQEAVKPVAERGNTLSNIHRFWIQAEELIYDESQDGSKLEVRISDLKMKIYSHPLLPGADGKLQDTENETDPDSPEAKFADDLTAHYNELGIHFPMFARLRELAKLQLLGIFLRGLMDDMKNKANGNGVEVPRRLLTEIQQNALQQHLTKVSEMLSNLSGDIGNWPAAHDSNEVSSLTWRLMDELPYHVRSQASYSDVEPYAREALRTKDDNVLTQVVDGFMQLCEHRTSRSNLQTLVRRWLSTRSSTETTELRNLICSTLPLPSHEDIKRQLVEFHRQKYHAFQRKVNSMIASPPQPDKNPCKWVPAALLKEENIDCVRMCYGGVLIAPDIKSGRVPNFPSHARAVPVRRSGASFQNRSDNSYFRAPSARSVPSGGTYSSGTGGVGISLSSRLTTQRPAKTSSAHKPLLNTFRNVYRSQGGDGRDGATGNSGRVGGRSEGSGDRRGGRGGNGDGRGGNGDGRGGNGDGKGGSKGGKLILIAAAAALVVKTTHQDDSNPNQRLQEQRKQARQRPPFWYEPRATILSPDGKNIQLPPGSEWNMKTSRVVYGLYSAKTGGLVYVGKTEQPLSTRIQAHVRDIRKGEKSTKLVKFFNSEDHSVDDLRAVVLEKVKLGENLVRREMDYIVKYDTKNSGANMRFPINLNRYTAAEQAF